MVADDSKTETGRQGLECDHGLHALFAPQQRTDDQIAGEATGRRAPVRRVETQRTETERVSRHQ